MVDNITDINEYRHIKEIRSQFTEEQLCRLDYLAGRINVLGHDPNIDEAIKTCYRIITKKLMDIDSIVVMTHDKNHVQTGIALETHIALVNLFIDLRDIVIDKPTNTTWN